jgi:serine/threonine protein kinase
LTKEEVNNFYKIKSELVSLDTNPKNSLILEHQKKKREIDNIHSEIDNLTNNKLSIRRKLNQLLHIAQGLKDIHQKNLVHRDFHAGNILKGVEQTSCLITDLGLCKSVNESSREEKIFGVMPYVAPEVLQGQSYTQASDIYSFGIVMAELLTGLPPYYDQKHDVNLGVEICQGLRPQFQIKIPQLLEELINRC